MHLFKNVYKITKIAVLLVTFLSTTFISWSQKYKGEYSLFIGGLTGGINFSQVDGDSYKGYDKIGIAGGGIVYIPFGPEMNLPIEGTIALSMEVNFSQKGSKGGLNPAYGLKSHTINLYYGEVPILINFYRGARKSIYGAGFSFGFLGLGEEIIERSSGPILRDAYPFNKLDFCFVLSPNFHIAKGFYINPRFSYSLASVRKNSGGLGRNEQYNNVVGLRLMYLFNREWD